MPSISREQKLLLMLLAAKPQQSPFAAEFAAGAGAIDWDVFAGLVRRHRVAGLVHAGLAVRPDIVMPTALRAQMAEAQTTNAQGLMRAIKLSGELASDLSSRGIACAVLKGHPLAFAHYPEPAQREMIDLDLLVGEERFAEAEAVVLGRGFERTFPDFAVDARCQSSLFRLHNGYSYQRKSDAMQLDLHWRTVQYAALLPGIDRSWREQLIEIEAGGRKVPVLRPDFHLVYVIAHGAKHGWMRLKWLVDLDRMLRTASPGVLDQAAELIRREGLEALIGGSLELVRELLGTPVPSAFAPFTGTGRAARVHRGARRVVLGEAVTRHARLADLPSFLRRIGQSLALKQGGGFRREVLLQTLARHGDLQRYRLSPDRVWLLALLSPVTLLLERTGLLRRLQ